MTRIASPHQPLPNLDARMAEKFLYHEARLLDEKNWKEWDALFTQDGTYWMPASADQPDPLNYVSLVYENKLLRAVRIERFDNENAHSLQPMPRSVHLVSNVMIDAYDDQTGACIVSSRFVVFEYRRDEQRIYGGDYVHDLIFDGVSFKISQKRVNLVNCESALDNINIYL